MIALRENYQPAKHEAAVIQVALSIDKIQSPCPPYASSIESCRLDACLARMGMRKVLQLSESSGETSWLTNKIDRTCIHRKLSVLLQSNCALIRKVEPVHTTECL